MADPIGSVFNGACDEFVIQNQAEDSPARFFLPDHKNDALQSERRAPSARPFRKGSGQPETPPTTPVSSGASPSLAASARPRPPLRGVKEEGTYG